MRMWLTVAQVYQQIAAMLTTDTTATTLKAGGDSYSVVIVDKTDTPTLDDIFNMEFETTTTDENGSSVKETHTLGAIANRTTTAGRVLGPEQRIAQRGALKAYTGTAAKGSGKGGVVGKIAPGYYADFVQLSGNPRTVAPESIESLSVLRTISGGRLVHTA